MDTLTTPRTSRQAAPADPLANLSGSGMNWFNHNRSAVLGGAIALVLLVVGIVVGSTLFNKRTATAATAFGQAMETYQTPLVTAGQPVPPGMKTFENATARAKAANAQFLSVADQYGATKPGKLARYFAGLTYMEEGQNSSAEDTLKKVADSWDANLAALGKSALAQLYQQTGRDAQAIPLYDELAKKNTDAVPAGLAKIQLAELYSSEGKTADAKKIYAELKDKDKDAKGEPGPAGTIAAQKLNPKPAQ